MRELLVVIYDIVDDAKPMLQDESTPICVMLSRQWSGSRGNTPALLGFGLKACWR